MTSHDLVSPHLRTNSVSPLGLAGKLTSCAEEEEEEEVGRRGEEEEGERSRKGGGGGAYPSLHALPSSSSRAEL